MLVVRFMDHRSWWINLPIKFIVIAIIHDHPISTARPHIVTLGISSLQIESLVGSPLQLRIIDLLPDLHQVLIDDAIDLLFDILELLVVVRVADLDQTLGTDRVVQ